MDRKAIARCAAATASLGALLSVGCGNSNSQPTATARQQTRPLGPPQAVVVSPEQDFFEPNSYTISASPKTSTTVEVEETTHHNGGQIAVAPVDPWAVDELVDSSAVPTPESAKTLDVDVPMSASGNDAPEAVAAEIESESVEAEAALEPVPAEPTVDCELKFADNSKTPAKSLAVETIKLDVQPSREKSASDTPSNKQANARRSKASTNSRFADTRRELLPVRVIARGSGSPLQPKSESPSLAKPEAKPEPSAVTTVKPTKPKAETPQVTSLSPAPIVPAITALSIKAEPAATPPAPQVVESEPTIAGTEPAPEVDAQTPTVARSEAQEVREPEQRIELESTLTVKAEPEIADNPTPIAQSEPVPVAKAETRRVAKPAQIAVDRVPTLATLPDSNATAGETKVESKLAARPPVDVEAVAPPRAAQSQSVASPAQPPHPTEIAKAAPPAVSVAPIGPAPIAVAPPAPARVEAARDVAATVPLPAPAAPLAEAPRPAPVAPSVPLPQVPGTRSPAMVATLAQADERVRHAIQLAEKGAMYASRKEFTSAINLIAQAHDVERGTRQFSKAVAAGLLALTEARDFVASSPADLDVARLVRGHQTPVLKQRNLSDMPPALAAQYYYGFAKEHLAAGVGRETVGSIALYGLGKIIIAGAGRNAQQMEFTGPAITLYQAALICEPQNFRAAHELGVLLAGSGQLELARELLMGSVAQSPQPIMLKNLAVVQSRLGEGEMAAQTRQQADALQQTQPDTKAPPVQWVDPATFASLGAQPNANIPSRPAPPIAVGESSRNESAKPAASVARKRPPFWNPLNLIR